MLRWLAVLTFCVLSSCASYPRDLSVASRVAASSFDPEAAAREALRTQVGLPGAAVHKWCDEHNEHELIGSAVYLGEDEKHSYFVTAAHVVDDKNTKTWQLVPSLGGIGADATVAVADAAEDVAILRAARGLPGWSRHALLAAPGDDYLFRRCVAYGHPTGLPRGHLTEGYVTAKVFGTRHQISAPIFFGNSGGGVYVNTGGRWRLLGVAQQIRGTPHIGLISSVDTIYSLLGIARDVAAAEVVK